MSNTSQKKAHRLRRHRRVRARISGTAARPRLAVFRSNRAIYAQLIDDTTGTTLAAAHSRQHEAATPVAAARAVGAAIAETAISKKISAVVFDRGGFDYKGAVAAVADAAREKGLSF